MVINMRNTDKFRGCLIGGAAGDALGYAVEFKSEDEIFSEYGKDGITEYDLILDDDVAEISDDTQMTLFTAEGMLLAGNENDNSAQENYTVRPLHTPHKSFTAALIALGGAVSRPATDVVKNGSQITDRFSITWFLGKQKRTRFRCFTFCENH